MLRTLMLGRELLNKQHTQIGIAIGEGISHSEVQHLCDQQLVNYLRLNTYLCNLLPCATRPPVIDPCLPLQSAFH